MNDFENQEKVDAEGVFSKVLRAGRRTYFFDVRETRAGDYYLTITESKKNTQDDGNVYYKKHKIYLNMRKKKPPLKLLSGGFYLFNFL